MVQLDQELAARPPPPALLSLGLLGPEQFVGTPGQARPRARLPPGTVPCAGGSGTAQVAWKRPSPSRGELSERRSPTLRRDLQETEHGARAPLTEAQGLDPGLPCSLPSQVSGSQEIKLCQGHVALQYLSCGL